MNERDETKPLREKLDIVQLRPPAPRESSRGFGFGEEVDAYHNDGWWEGVITRDNEGVFTVYFRGTKEELEFGAEELRVHREWVKGVWVPPLEIHGGNEIALNTHEEAPLSSITENFGNGTLVEVTGDNSNVEEPSKNIVEKFDKGTLVEVSTDEEGLQGAWFAATIIDKFSNDEYMIEYQSLVDDDGAKRLKEKANIKHIRPYPPETADVDYFRVLQEVDALYKDGWWVGVITKAMQGKKYYVYFRATDEETVFKQSDLRPHQDWIDGKWVISFQALKL
ncbi:hypothetical protein ACET3Z_030850 [Daucus carota]